MLQGAHHQHVQDNGGDGDDFDDDKESRGGTDCYKMVTTRPERYFFQGYERYVHDIGPYRRYVHDIRYF